jgi:hypothetical protein
MRKAYFVTFTMPSFHLVQILLIGLRKGLYLVNKLQNSLLILVTRTKEIRELVNMSLHFISHKLWRPFSLTDRDDCGSLSAAGDLTPVLQSDLGNHLFRDIRRVSHGMLLLCCINSYTFSYPFLRAVKRVAATRLPLHHSLIMERSLFDIVLDLPYCMSINIL